MGLPGLEPGTSSLSVKLSLSFVQFIGFDGPWDPLIYAQNAHPTVIEPSSGGVTASPVAVNLVLARSLPTHIMGYRHPGFASGAK